MSPNDLKRYFTGGALFYALKREEFAEIVSQYIAGNNGVRNFNFRILFMGDIRESILSLEPSGSLFSVPFDSNFRVVISREQKKSVPADYGMGFPLMQYNVRKLPMSLEEIGYFLSGFVANIKGRPAMEVSDPGLAAVVWRSLLEDRNIEFSTLYFSTSTGTVQIDRDLRIRVVNPTPRIGELISEIMMLVSTQRTICLRFYESLRGKPTEGEAWLPEPVRLPFKFEEIEENVRKMDKFTITRKFGTGFVSSRNTEVGTVVKNEGGSWIIPDPSADLLGLMDLIDSTVEMIPIE